MRQDHDRRQDFPADRARDGHALDGYNAGPHFCEWRGLASAPKPELDALWRRLRRFDPARLAERRSPEPFAWAMAAPDFDGGGASPPLAVDAIPRALVLADWKLIEAGVRQRVRALNLFLWDIYHKRHILKDGTLPPELVLGSASFHPAMEEFDPPCGTYTHVAGIAVIRNRRGEFLVTAHNHCTPLGARRVIENRRLMQRAFQDVMRGFDIAPVDDYAARLIEKLGETAAGGVDEPQIVMLAAGPEDPSYLEHLHLAREMGAPLVEGRDLVVENDQVFMKTVAGLEPVHVIYRRVGDCFLADRSLADHFPGDALPDVAALLRAVRRGGVTLANAIGAGVVDDRPVYAHTPRIIRYYLDEDPILPNVETYLCRDPRKLAYTLENLPNLIVKPVDGLGGVCAGPLAVRADIELWRSRIKQNPAGYMAQPLVDFSVCPTFAAGGGVEPRRVDLRPFAITGAETWVLPGGLTRVAGRSDSMIVDLTQGAGAKDTWVLRSAPPEGEAES